jgi:hypothetical protein
VLISWVREMRIATSSRQDLRVRESGRRGCAPNRPTTGPKQKRGGDESQRIGCHDGDAKNAALAGRADDG